MESKKYLDDISEIRNLMNRSSRFISLSGLSGIMAGIYALFGAWLAKLKLNEIARIDYENFETDPIKQEVDLAFDLVFIACSVAFLAIVTGIVLTTLKARKQGEKIWDLSSKRLLLNFLIPLISGGIFCLALLYHQYYGLTAPATLIFYGLACVHASKYTLGTIKYLGISCIILGLISGFYIGYGLLFWALGFGVCHIIYGTIMYFKHDKK